MRLRQFVYVAETLEPLVGDICDVLGLDICYRDPGVGEFGLENALMAVNGNFIEVVAPTREGTSASRHIERRGGDGGYMLLFQCDDAVAERERIKGLGLRTVWEHDEADCSASHIHPVDLPGAILSIDTMTQAKDWHEELSDWKWAGPDWPETVRTERSQSIVAVEIQGPDPKALAERWGQVLDRPVTVSGEILLDNARMRFVEATDGRGIGLGGLDILPQNRAAIIAAAKAKSLTFEQDYFVLGGVRIRLV